MKILFFLKELLVAMVRLSVAITTIIFYYVPAGILGEIKYKIKSAWKSANEKYEKWKNINKGC